MIYLDYQSTTPLAPEVRAAMQLWHDEAFGNPHSPHRMGRMAKAAVELARERIAAPFGPGGRLVFTAFEAPHHRVLGPVSSRRHAGPASGDHGFVQIHACVRKGPSQFRAALPCSICVEKLTKR